MRAWTTALVLGSLGLLCGYCFRNNIPWTDNNGQDILTDTDEIPSTNRTTTTLRRLHKSKKAEPPPVQPSPFLANYPELHQLVQLWNQKGPEASPEAREKLWEIIRSREYIRQKPHLGMYFIKTFKTGSSTITSILHAIATAHRLNAPVTLTAEWPGYSPQVMQQISLTGQPGGPFDMWYNHARYDDKFLSEVVPSAHGRYFTILRDPGTRLRSWFTTDARCVSNVNQPVQSTTMTYDEWTNYILNDPQLPQSLTGECTPDYSTIQIVGTGDKHAIEQQFVSGQFLMLVMERMFESLLALQDFYKLHPLDITFFTMREHSQEIESNEPESERNKQALQRVNSWCPEDVYLHTIGNQLMDQRLQNLYGVDTDKVLSEVDTLNRIVFTVCSNILGANPTQWETNAEAHVAKFHSNMGYWCFEKRMDNDQWNEYHLNRLKTNKSIPYYDGVDLTSS